MSNTIRRDKSTGQKLRDGQNQSHIKASSCEHNNSCVWCTSNRTIDMKRLLAASRVPGDLAGYAR
jgi:hypothetical protein